MLAPYCPGLPLRGFFGLPGSFSGIACTFLVQGQSGHIRVHVMKRTPPDRRGLAIGASPPSMDAISPEGARMSTTAVELWFDKTLDCENCSLLTNYSHTWRATFQKEAPAFTMY
jgi:hypothetical protein